MSKKLINNPKNVVREMLERVVDSTEGLALLAHANVVLQADLPEPDQRPVAIISGGGSGHEPAHAGYVGKSIPAETVVVVDDVSLHQTVSEDRRRGIAGTILIHKIADVAAAGKSLAEVADIARTAASDLATWVDPLGTVPYLPLPNMLHK